MRIVSLTSDLGISDPYLADLKGNAYAKEPEIKLLDVNHNIKKFFIAEAAYNLKRCFRSFPSGSIHIIGVENPEYPDKDYIGVEAEGHYFFANNNGVVPLIVEESEMELVHLNNNHIPSNFPMRDILLPAALKIYNGQKLNEIGEPYSDEMIRLSHQRPVLLERIIRGTIIYVDSYGNAISNINQEHLDAYKHLGKPIINYSRRDYIRNISFTYNDVPEGEKLCFFNEGGNLEIAISMGNASQLLGLNAGNTIMIEFE